MAKKTDALDALASLATAAPKKGDAKKKAAMPQKKLTSDVEAGAVRTWLDGKEAQIRGEALMADAEGVLKDIAVSFLKDESMRTGSVVKSVRLVGDCDLEGPDGNTEHFNGGLRVTQASKFLGMGADEKDRLAAEFTDDDEFKRFFEVSREFSIDLEKLNERPGLAARLQKALGADADILTLETSIKPTEAFVTSVMTDRAMQKRWDKLIADGLCKLQKPSFAR